MQQIKGPIGVFDSGYGGLTILRKLQEACPLWVPIVETGESDSPGTDFFVRKHLERLLAQDEKIDTIILGCTHYPILMPKIQRLLTQMCIRDSSRVERYDDTGTTSHRGAWRMGWRGLRTATATLQSQHAPDTASPWALHHRTKPGN